MILKNVFSAKNFLTLCCFSIFPNVNEEYLSKIPLPQFKLRLKPLIKKLKLKNKSVQISELKRNISKVKYKKLLGNKESIVFKVQQKHVARYRGWIEQPHVESSCWKERILPQRFPALGKPVFLVLPDYTRPVWPTTDTESLPSASWKLG